MCIIFLWRQKSNELIGHYKFILAANRDETFFRPAKAAHYWEEDPNLLAGQDMTEGVGGGTWLGVTKTGQISAITNIRVFDQTMQYKQGRGRLIADFLKIKKKDNYRYLQELEIKPFRPFNLIAGNLKGELYYISNGKENQQPLKIDKGYFCMTNSHIDSVWKKATHGINLFENALQTYSPSKSIETILFEVLQDTQTNYPDPELEEGNPLNELMSSVFLPTLDSGYGTRTHTIVTVDVEDNVTLTESTKLEVFDEPSKWQTSRFQFKMS